jgi:hypothetical protein
MSDDRDDAADAELEEERIDDGIDARVRDVEDLDEIVAEQEETPFDETRLEYSGVEEGDGDVDVEEYEEAGALFDDPEVLTDPDR